MRNIYQVYIDIDKKFQNYIDLVEYVDILVFRRFTASKLLNIIELKSIFYRLSSNKNIHLKIIYQYRTETLQKKIVGHDCEFLIQLMIRAIFSDDPVRVSFDLQRYARFWSLIYTDRLFDRKAVITRTGAMIVKRAGKWFRIYPYPFFDRKGVKNAL